MSSLLRQQLDFRQVQGSLFPGETGRYISLAGGYDDLNEIANLSFLLSCDLGSAGKKEARLPLPG